MQNPRVRFARIRAFRQQQLEAEELKLAPLLQELAALDEKRVSLSREGDSAERAVLLRPVIASQELAMLGHFRALLGRRQQETAAARADCEIRIAAQRERVMAAERRLRMLDRLLDRRAAEWQAALDHAAEQSATELYLAKWLAGNQNA